MESLKLWLDKLLCIFQNACALYCLANEVREKKYFSKFCFVQCFRIGITELHIKIIYSFSSAGPIVQVRKVCSIEKGTLYCFMIWTLTHYFKYICFSAHKFHIVCWLHCNFTVDINRDGDLWMWYWTHSKANTDRLLKYHSSIYTNKANPL